MPTMRNRLLYFIGFLTFVSLACSLATEAPPTLAPSTPMSTITPESAIVPPTLQVQAFEVEPPIGIVEQGSEAPIVAPSSIAMVNGERMIEDIKTLVSFETRHILSSPAPNRGIQAAQNWLIEELKAIAATSPNPGIQIDVYPHTFRMEWAGQEIYPSNIIMSITGTDAAAGVVMFTAHYDTALQNWFNGDSYQPGANDNGSGIAAILELARIAVQKPHRATIVFVMFTAEETGRQGSQTFVRDYISVNNIPLTAVINMDIIGNPTGRRGERYDNMMRIFSAGPNESSASRMVARMIDVAVTRYVPGMTLTIEDSLDRAGRWGDHMSFSDEGYPAVRLIEAADDPTIAHTTRDTIDLIDVNYLTKTTQVILAALEMFADGPNPPSLRPLRQSTTDAGSMVLEWSHNPVCQSYVVALRGFGSLRYDEFYTVQATTSLSWNGFRTYEAVSVACVDMEGRLGRFAPELLIQPVISQQSTP